MFRRLLPALLLVLAFACGGADDATDADGTTTTTTTATTDDGHATTSTASNGEDEGIVLTQSCSREEAGWQVTVAYPDGWVTNEETPLDRGTVPACRLFDPDDATPPRPDELSGFGVITYVDQVDYGDAIEGEPFGAEVLEEAELTIAGQDAIRREDRLAEDGLRGPEGARVTIYIVDLDGSIFVATTTELEDLDYETNREVLDQMMQQLELERT